MRTPLPEPLTLPPELLVPPDLLPPPNEPLPEELPHERLLLLFHDDDCRLLSILCPLLRVLL